MNEATLRNRLEALEALAENLELENKRLRIALKLIAAHPDSGRAGRIALATLDNTRDSHT